VSKAKETTAALHDTIHAAETTITNLGEQVESEIKRYGRLAKYISIGVSISVVIVQVELLVIIILLV
jgi:hypothetical protein